MSVHLLRYDAACRAVADAKSVDEVKEVRDRSEAIRVYARQASNRDLEIDAAEIRFRAERRLGEMIQQQKETVGLASGGDAMRARYQKGTEVRPTLADIGIDKKLSSRAQKLAAVPADDFEGMIGNWRDNISKENERVTVNLLKQGEKFRDRQAYEQTVERGCTVADLSLLARSGKKFPVIYADPPWEFKVYSGKGKARSAEQHYNTQSLDDIKAMPVAAFAADDCALFLWCVMPELPGALDVISAWGFQYKTCAFTWVKQNRSGQGIFTGMGYWTRANAELCLLATKGSPQRQAMDVGQIVQSPVSRHSRKPDEVRSRIERLLLGPYLELYGRDLVDGWTVWGNEIEQDEFVSNVEKAG